MEGRWFIRYMGRFLEGLKLRMLALHMSDGFRCLPVPTRPLL